MKKPVLILSVFVTAAAALEISAQAEETTPAPAAAQAVTPIADVKRGTMVTLKGTVERITDEDEFRLTDTTGSIRV